MSAASRTRYSATFGTGAFASGIAFIVAATVLNIAHDHISGFELETLPFYVGTLYATTGKIGVTLLLVTLGMVCLLLGARVSARRVGDRDALSSAQYWTTPSGTTYLSSPGRTGCSRGATGRVALETWKYVAPPDEQAQGT